MRRLTLMVAALMMVALPLWAGAQQGHAGHGGDMEPHGDEAMKSVTFEGEVLDMYCFMKHPADGQGAEHAKCATNCINQGLPIGFKVGDDVYLIIGKGHNSAAEMVAGYAGQTSRLKGTLIHHHGMMAIEIDSIEKI